MSVASDRLVLAVQGRGLKIRPKANGKGWMAQCPAHDDAQASLSITIGGDGRVLLHCHAGCTLDAITSALGIEARDLFDGNPARAAARAASKAASGPAVARPSITLAALAADKGIGEAVLASFGLRDLPNGRVGIPYHDATGTFVTFKHRTALSAREGSFWPTGQRLMVYGLERKRGDVVLLVEGESDCWTLWANGYDALGIPGAGATATLDAEHVATVKRLYVVREPDSGGTQFVEGIAKRLADIGFQGDARVLPFTKEAKDPNALYRLDPARFRAALDAMIAKAEPLTATGEPAVEGPAVEDTRPEVRITPSIDTVVDAAAKAIADQVPCPIWQRGGIIVRVREDAGSTVPWLTREPGTPWIEPIGPASLREIMARAARWTAATKDGDRHVIPPGWAVEALMGRPAWPFPLLEGIVESPIVRRDLSIVESPGYDPGSAMLYVPAGPVDPIPKAPTFADASLAVDALMEPFREFPFVAPCDRAAMLALVLSLLARPAIAGPVPLFAARSPSPGRGSRCSWPWRGSSPRGASRPA
jgi:hypothetical protein